LVNYYVTDHLGTTRVIVQSGQTTPCYDADFYPYGGERVPVINSCPQNYKFNGKERDSESDFDNFGARYFISNMGRWSIPDWASKPSPVPFADFTDPRSLNLYAYSFNNPLSLRDKDGHWPNEGTRVGYTMKILTWLVITDGGPEPLVP
jgi:RHS repeat-associated protein